MHSGGRVLRKWHWRLISWIGCAAVLIWARTLVWQAAVQLFLGWLVALCALPVMKRLEKRLSCGLAAGLSLAALGMFSLGILMLLLPPLIRQGRQLAAMLPGLLNGLHALLISAQRWLAGHGIPADGALQEMLFSRGEAALGAAAPALMSWMGDMAGGIGQGLLAPVFAFYFLRDRRRIGQWLLLLLPSAKRRITVRMLREMRRETAGYLRGQLMISAAVGGLTAIGLLFCGVPAWLALGALMGLLELIPYAGPFLGGALVAVFSLPLGAGRMLWALGVVVLVQQAEGSLLSPRMIGEATRLHPVAILLCVTLGAAAGGVAGVLLAAPVVLCLRAALRVISEQSVHEC